MKKMFNYLNTKQVNDIMILFCVSDTLETIIKEWNIHENMTKEEAKYVKTANTWMNKFLHEVQARITDKEKAKLLKRYSNFELKIMDKWMLSKFNTELMEKGEKVTMERKHWEVLATQLLATTCDGCNELHDNCSLHDTFHENLTPPYNRKKNCPFAHDTKANVAKLKLLLAKKKGENKCD